ncbi:prolyl oligopeptidase family serine peptidase [Roseateles saccharophilus]|uniref:Glutamyl peptidase n=1 Tax=Roseateles saccharophilus TaxID=304 RepID=A0A4R3VH51_ROSSA|nr:prolyl oligopeptidase family serine peptidase [Roseateles saccharophilus]TCV03383.1 glutamyl peptidase [Roseateles saccharophilus]
MTQVRPLPLALALAAGLAGAPSFAQTGYDKPPEPLLGVMHTPLPPSAIADPTDRTLLMVQQAQYPSIRRVAEPYLKLAGVRVEPRTGARHDASNGYGIRACLEGFALIDIASGEERRIALPAGACPGLPTWSPDGRRFAFGNTVADHVELWVGDVASGAARRIAGVRLNTILGNDIQWLGGGAALLVKQLPAGRGPAPSQAAAPIAPEIRESLGGKGESSTYEARDTLTGPEDEALFDHYASAQLAKVDLASGKLTPLGKPGVIAGVEVAPDGRHVLYEALKRPYSYATTWQRFAHDTLVLDAADGRATLIDSAPVADRVPVRGVPTGPRDFGWRANAPATLVWAEALDQGDWKLSVPLRDKVLMQSAPFTAKPVEILRTPQRFSGMAWLEKGDEPFVYEFDANRRWVRVTRIDVSAPDKAPRVVWDHSADERYRNPGALLMRRLANGATVVREDAGKVYLRGNGATPQGDRPFLDRYDLATGRSERLFRSGNEALERVIAVIDGGSRFLVSRQSPAEPPNVFMATLGAANAGAAEGEARYAVATTAVTHIPDPMPQVRGVKKRLVSYKRKDGVELSFTLYTPPGYQEGTRLPAVLYAYPLDYADPSKAGQVSGSQQSFDFLRGHRLLLLAGYAIIDNAAFPIVGDPKSAYDTYLDQLIADAQAAVDKAVELGVVDRDRIGVTGHSHGALMTANLLAHTGLFRAGVATSGSYNKTLTPFGFQNEPRSLWAATPVYEQASAFFHANKIKSPLLIMHGMDDANPGTEPVQAPKLFQAIRGLGGTTRLVMLPHEPHWYTAMESNEQEVYEMLTWFDRYVKNAAPR